MDFSNRHLNRVKTLFWRRPPIYPWQSQLYSFVCFSFTTNAASVKPCGVYFSFTCIFFLMFKLNYNFFGYYNLVIFVIFLTFSFAAFEITFFPLVCKCVIKCWIIIIINSRKYTVPSQEKSQTSSTFKGLMLRTLPYTLRAYVLQ